MKNLRTLALETIRQTRALALLIGLTAGCVASAKPTKKAYEFYPPPPDEPRLQFLTAFSSEKEFRGKDENSLMSFLTGVKPPAKEIGKPYGGGANGHKFFVCDTAIQAVLVADLPTKRFTALDAQGEGALKQPQNVSFDPDDCCYVTDTGRQQVVIFDKDKNYLATIGRKGEMKPLDAVASKERIYVADLMKHDVLVFDKSTRNVLFEIPRSLTERTNRTRGLFTPTNLALDSKGRLYVGDSGAFRVQVYDAEGNYLRSVGEMGDRLGQFGRVKGVAVDRENRLYAVDAMSQATQVFNEDGRLLTWFAEPETASQVQNLPAKVFLDYDDVSYFKGYAAPNFEIEYLVVIINQLGSHKVSIYGFGHKK